jgi:flagellin-like hook-associated protein FlgL
VLQSFETLVTAEIQYERQSIQDELENIMDDLLNYFNESLFASTTGVSFKSEKTYNFTIYRSNRETNPLTDRMRIL